MKTEAYKLHSRAIWIFLPNDIKIDPYSFELYRFKVGAFFSETRCSLNAAWHTAPVVCSFDDVFYL